MDSIIMNLSIAGTEKIIDKVFDHVTTTVRSNSLRVIGGLVLACSNANPAYTLKKFVPLCAERIESELSSGAGSRRTLNSTIPIASDVALQWHVALLVGAVSGASIEVGLNQTPCKQDRKLNASALTACGSRRSATFPVVKLDGKEPIRGMLVLGWKADGESHLQHDYSLPLRI
jgi:hypothetical protein